MVIGYSQMSYVMVTLLVSDKEETRYNHFYTCHMLDQSRSAGNCIVLQMRDSQF